jgi:hypothetical protein
MATLVENLKARRAAIGVELAALTSTAAGGKPNNKSEGINVDHVGYKEGLYRELESLKTLISQAEQDEASDSGNVGIFETYME